MRRIMQYVTTRRSAEQVRQSLELRRSNAAAKHRNRAKEIKHPGKGNRSNWKREV